ncbi:hypothetical protein D3C81_1412860 [compost metagenome]
MIVRVLPRAEVIVCGKPTATPPLMMLTPPMLRLCKPSGAEMLKVPFWVKAPGLLAEPLARLASNKVSSPPATDRPDKVTGWFSGNCGVTGNSGLMGVTGVNGLIEGPVPVSSPPSSGEPATRSGTNSGMPLKPAVGNPMTGSTRPATSSSRTNE